MKTDQLITKMRTLGLNMPKTGTGKNGRILARDLEYVLGSHYVEGKYNSVKDIHHLHMRRQCIPQKAYRYDKLSEEYKSMLWKSDNWVAEEKMNGWRMIITFVPHSGFKFWGGNISDVDFLPVDYTDHILLCDKHPQHEHFHNLFTQPLLLDSEVICNDEVEMLDGMWSTTTLDAVKAVLGCDVDRAHELQKYADLEFHLFDCITYNTCGSVKDHDLLFRRIILETVMSMLKPLKHFHIVKQVETHKKKFLRDVWRKGGEGIILKNLLSKYEPASRKKDVNVKVKRKVSGEIGDDIDAFIIGHINTPEWTKKGLIGGVKLGVYDEDGNERHIATVTNMPDEWRYNLTNVESFDCIKPTLHAAFKNRVVVVDGQELSGRNQLLMHAVVDWERGFRQSKRPEDCTFKFSILQNERF